MNLIVNCKMSLLKSTSGITFLEVVIAGFILSLAVVAFLPLFSQPLDSIPTKSEIIAATLAHRELEELKKAGTFPLIAGEATIIPPSPWNNNYTIVKTIGNPSPAAGTVKIQDISISVYEGGGITLPLPNPSPTLFSRIESNYIGDSNLGGKYGL